MIVIPGKFYEFFWQRDCIQRKILLRKSYFEYFFRADWPQYVQTNAKNPKTDEYLKWKITREILKITLKSRSSTDFFHSQLKNHALISTSNWYKRSTCSICFNLKSLKNAVRNVLSVYYLLRHYYILRLRRRSEHRRNHKLVTDV